MDSIRWAAIYSFSIYAMILLFLERCPSLVLNLFDASEEMMGIGIPALRILAISYLVSTIG